MTDAERVRGLLGLVRMMAKDIALLIVASGEKIPAYECPMKEIADRLDAVMLGFGEKYQFKHDERKTECSSAPPASPAPGNPSGCPGLSPSSPDECDPEPS